MDNMKMQIELNNHPYEQNMLYAAVSLRGGFVTRDFILGEKEHFVSNCAFYNVLFNYYRLESNMPGLHFDIQRAVSTISFSRKKAELASALRQVILTILNSEYNEEAFKKAKHTAREAFAARYKEGAFRAQYKAYEFSDLNKRFTLRALIDDIEKIDFDTFVSCARALLVPGNICVYIIGQTDELDISELAFEDEELPELHNVHIAGYGYDPYLRQDAHVVNVARQDVNLMVEAFDFMSECITNFAKLMITELLAEHIEVLGAEVWVDALDASIIFPVARLDSYKRRLIDCSEQSFLTAQKRLLAKYIILMHSSPELFAIKAAGLMTVGVYIDQYLEFLNSCTYELFDEMCTKADFKISEAQVVLRKESK